MSLLPFTTAFVTGAAGFIGSHLVDRLLSSDVTVVGYDNLSTGFQEFVTHSMVSERFQFVRGDVLDLEAMTKAMRGADIVFHLAANADVRFGPMHPFKDLEQNTLATFNVLEAMRSNQVGTIVFASTGSVYGEANVVPTPEDAPFPIQTSFYGASKLAGEALIAAYAEAYGIHGLIFRCVSILGERYTHGHVIDFYKKLRADPTLLHVLGDGRQKKSYLYVHDGIDAMLHVIKHRARTKINIFNLGTQEYCEVNQSIEWITTYLGLRPRLIYSGGDRGWIGDNPFIFLDTAKIRMLGWQPRLSIADAVTRTIAWLVENSWVVDRLGGQIALSPKA
jgi:UDP-glucose 4-epimerase